MVRELQNEAYREAMREDWAKPPTKTKLSAKIFTWPDGSKHLKPYEREEACTGLFIIIYKVKFVLKLLKSVKVYKIIEGTRTVKYRARIPLN